MQQHNNISTEQQRGSTHRQPQRTVNWVYLTPLIFAPAIPLARIASTKMRLSVKAQRYVMLGMIGAGLSHGTYLMTMKP